jgi:archaellum component FlaC
MSDDVCDRIKTLEMEVSLFKEKINEMRRKYDRTAEKLDKIDNNLKNVLSTVKWSAITCVVTILAQNFGVLEVLKSLFLK